MLTDHQKVALINQPLVHPCFANTVPGRGLETDLAYQLSHCKVPKSVLRRLSSAMEAPEANYLIPPFKPRVALGYFFPESVTMAVLKGKKKKKKPKKNPLKGP